MKLSEAIAALEHGKKVRTRGWRSGVYLYYDEYQTCLTNNGCHFEFSKDETAYVYWEIYEEPKPEASDQDLAIAEINKRIDKLSARLFNIELLDLESKITASAAIAAVLYEKIDKLEKRGGNRT